MWHPYARTKQEMNGMDQPSNKFWDLLLLPVELAFVTSDKSRIGKGNLLSAALKFNID